MLECSLMHISKHWHSKSKLSSWTEPHSVSQTVRRAAAYLLLPHRLIQTGKPVVNHQWPLSSVFVIRISRLNQAVEEKEMNCCSPPCVTMTQQRQRIPVNQRQRRAEKSMGIHNNVSVKPACHVFGLFAYPPNIYNKINLFSYRHLYICSECAQLCLGS